jgi:putative colanic acid biosynthesis acetyltransferase WcaF
MPTDLSKFNNDWYNPGASVFKIVLWQFFSACFFLNHLSLFNSLKVGILRLFGARIGKGVVIKQNVRIKYPWLLEVGNYVWIGECCWIENHALVKIKSNACISQGAMLLCGNHNYKSPYFDLITKEITLDEGAWIGARSVVCPGVTCGSHSVLTVGSVASSDLQPYGIYRGNPATLQKERVISQPGIND